MHIHLQNLGKRFNHHWIFRRINHKLVTGKSYAIIGPNGSGKSTLLQIIAGAIQQSEGQVEIIQLQDPGLHTQAHTIQRVTSEKHYQFFSIATPYIELIEELTLKEFLAFHFRFKPILPSYTVPSIIDYIRLQDAENKQIRYFSSGMKQRVKLAQAIFSNTPVVLLDEPTTNLDSKGVALYCKMIDEFCKNKLIVICSNDEKEIDFCHERIDMMHFKHHL